MKRALSIAAVSLFVAVPAAHADGLPVLGIDVGASGVAAPSGDSRYVTLPAKQSPAIQSGTVVARVRRYGGQVLASRLVPGNFTIPAVAYDSSASGLSGDRRTLVLIEPRRAFPRRETTLLVLGAPYLQTRKLVHLRGDFSFDAISPDGKRLFLIQYTSPNDPTRYRVRAYDVTAARLVSHPVTDPHETSDKMRGNPLSRATSADGRFAYTLYNGGGNAPFIHALDTAKATARCIDLDALAGKNLSRPRLRMSVDGTSVAVRDGARTLLSLDTSTLVVRAPELASASGGFPLTTVLLACVGALLAAGAVSALWLRRRAPALDGAYQSVGR